MCQYIRMEKKMLPFIDYSEIIDAQSVFYAHTHNQRKELLKEHIDRCQKYFQKLYDDKNIEMVIQKFHQNLHFQNENASFDFLKELLIQLVSFHDFGKINPEFQRIKMNNNVGKQYMGLTKSEHSFFSAIIYLDYFLHKLSLNKVLVENDRYILERIIVEHAYIIARHHSDLESLSQFTKRLEENQTQYLIENLLSNPLNGYNGLRHINKKIILLLVSHLYDDQPKYSFEELAIHFFYYRLAYSLLVASDYYATSEFMKGHDYDIIGGKLSIQDYREEYNTSKLLKSIRDYEKDSYQGVTKHFNDISKINDLRSELFLDAEKNLLNDLDKSIYFLEAPTGSGKSNTAFNLSFHLMQNRKKMFYIYPFNTLVEQNRQTLNKLFPQKKFQDQIVVVNSLTPLPQSHRECKDTDDSTNFYQKQLLDRQFLNYPLILSTHVSFFNLLFGDKQGDVMGFHQLSESVIVLDEIQSYRNEIWAEMIILLKACAELMNMKIIMMSATLPNLEKLSGQNNVIKHLLPNCHLYYQHRCFKERVIPHYELLENDIELEDLMDHIIAHQSHDKKILVEFIFKNTAYQFYKMLSESDDVIVDVKCITGDDSLIEREKILKPIKSKEASGLILIATQVIEAGVDIDMDIGFKNISLLDSEEQFLGRINRSCESKGHVYFFKHDSYSTIYRSDYRASDTLTLMSNNMRNIFLNKDFSQYYDRIMQIIKKARNESTADTGLDNFFNNLIFKLNFLEISKRMKLIDDENWSIDVVFCRKIELEDGSILDGWNVWSLYKNLLQDNEMDYAEKQVKLIEVRSKLSYFTYRLKNNIDIQYNDIIGELYCIEDASEFFINGKLDRDKIGKLSYDIL